MTAAGDGPTRPEHEQPTVYASVCRRLAAVWSIRAGELAEHPTVEWRRGAQTALYEAADELVAMAANAEARWSR